jgi:hypothetical protein
MLNFIKSIWQIIAIIWFAIVSAIILIPSWSLVRSIKPGQEILRPPGRPISPIENTDIEIYKLRVAAYKDEVEAYKQELTAYNTFLNNLKINSNLTYQAVVKDTLLQLLTTFLTALLTFVFVKEGAKALANFINNKFNKKI